jgi:hypothetical protein
VDAGVGLEAAAEPAGLVAHVHDLEHGRFASASEPGQLTEAQPGPKQGQYVVPPGQRAGGEQPTGFLGRVGSPFCLAQDFLGVGPRANRSGSVVALEPSVRGVDSMQDGQGAVKPRT